MTKTLLGKRRPGFVSATCLSLFAVLVCDGTAHAADGDVFTPYIQYGVFYDDNLLRNPDGVVSFLHRNGVETSDWWQRADVGLRVDKLISRQRLTADVSMNQSKYNNFDRYDNDGSAAQLNLAWLLGSQFTGNVGATYREELTPFEDFRGASRAIRTQQRAYVDGGWQFHPDWRVSAALSQYALRYDESVLDPSERDVTTSEIGVDYLTKARNSIGLHVRHIDADYPSASFNRYTQNELNTKVDWQATGKTRIQFLGGVVRREYPSDSRRDSSGPNARLNVHWAATGKTGLTLAVWREFGAIGDLAANYALNKGGRLGATWDATSKIKVDAAVMSEKRDYNGVTIVAGTSPLDREDKFRRASLGMTYAALRNLKIRLSAYREKLDSNTSQFQYRTHGYQVTTSYEF